MTSTNIHPETIAETFFPLEIDPSGLDQHTDGAKLDAGKTMWDLLPLDALEQVANVMTFGATKYTPNGWKYVDNAENRYYSAQMRHEVLKRRGDIWDKETKLLHAAHAACNALFRLQLDLEKLKRETE